MVYRAKVRLSLQFLGSSEKLGGFIPIYGKPHLGASGAMSVF